MTRSQGEGRCCDQVLGGGREGGVVTRFGGREGGREVL